MSRGAEQVVEDYKALLEKSQSFFNGLRDLPQYENKQWKMFYEKTFEVYTKLWKYQQEHRAILENSDMYGLKRWQIGEIASKIGQLYYHYYLRTSDLLYLKEAYVFYEAIRSRGYFHDVVAEQSVALVVKKLRYFARFCLVCLLLDRRVKAHELMEELTVSCDEYASTFNEPDAVEWTGVTEELRHFLAATHVVRVVGVPELQQLPLYVPENPTGDLKLQVAVLVGAGASQTKFSEMPLEVFRVTTAIEATNSGAQQTSQCPTKHLHFSPSFDRLFVTISSVVKELPDQNSAVLLYISADAFESEGRKGLMLGEGGQAANASGALFVEDIVPFTRRPLFLVLDSPGPTDFAGCTSMFGQALVVLMAPEETPAEVPDCKTIGSLFNLFLTQPLHALCASCNIEELESDVYSAAEEALTALFGSIYEELLAAPALDPSIQSMMGDAVLCNLLFRFIFFKIVAQCHVHFRQKPSCCPAISPALPDEIQTSVTLQDAVLQLGEVLSTGCLSSS